MDGVLIDLLNAKWNAFVKFRFYRQFFLFLFYFLISLICFTLRPGPPPVKPISSFNSTKPSGNNITAELSPESNATTVPKWIYKTEIKKYDPEDNSSQNSRLNVILREVILTSLKVEDIDKVVSFSNAEPQDNSREDADGLVCNGDSVHSCLGNGSDVVAVFGKGKSPKVPKPGASADDFDYDDTWWEEFGQCRLLQVTSYIEMTRLISEVLLDIGALLYILAALREARFLGWSMFVENLMTAPSRVMFLFSCCLMLTMPFLRFTCNEEIEDMMAVIIMLTTAPYFLFFCRGFKTVGPFVVMIYRMIMGDLLRFATIYLVFVMGFAQAYYIIFLSFDNPLTPEGVDDSVSNPIPNPMEAVMAMFFMSMTSFGDYYPALERTAHEFCAKLCFVIYMAIVAILLVNMLIAMMGNTYQKIAETRNEWQRQWARIVLVVERGVSPSERLTKLMWYSQPMSDGRRALVLRLNQSEEDKEEMKEILEMKRIHNRMVQKRKEREKSMNKSPNLINLNSPAENVKNTNPFS
ncbi:unnamed protein product [Nezara viridula]|uniref:Ion transport domain-containing protein n=1 Tax=Nezara viridula TaxID=85310 RepID=A0A9P0GYH5_NEZVI|nr:unnamed protein product [Nezara viridula]